MEFSMDTQTGLSFRLRVNASISVAEFKAEVRSMLPSDSGPISLFTHTSELLNEAPMFQYSSEPSFLLLLPGTMQLYFTTTDAQSSSLIVRTDCKVAEAKRYLSLSDHTRLMYRGLLLAENSLISDCGVGNRSTVTVIRPDDKCLYVTCSFTGCIALAHRENSISILKKLISVHFGVPIENQTLFHNGKELDRRRSLSYFNVSSGDSVTVIQPGERILYVETTSQLLIGVALKVSDTVGDIKRRIEEMKGLSKFQLVLGTKVLADEQRFDDSEGGRPQLLLPSDVLIQLSDLHERSALFVCLPTSSIQQLLSRASKSHWKNSVGLRRHGRLLPRSISLQSCSTNSFCIVLLEDLSCNIKTTGNDHFSVYLPPSRATVAATKADLEQIEGFAHEIQTLTFAGELADEYSLAEYHFASEKRLILLVDAHPYADPIVHIKSHSNAGSFSVGMLARHFAVDIGKSLCSSMNLGWKSTDRLMLNGRALEDDCRLEDCSSDITPVFYYLRSTDLFVQARFLSDFILTLPYFSTTTIRQLKETIHEYSGCSVKRMCLSKSGAALKDSCMISDSKISCGDEINVSFPSSLELVIIAADSHTISIGAEPTDTVSDLKVKIEAVLQIPAQDQRLFFRGLEMIDSHICESYSLTLASVIHLMSPCDIRLQVTSPLLISTFAFYFSSAARVREVKQEISHRIYFPANKIRLVVSCELQDSYDIRPFCHPAGKGGCLELSLRVGTGQHLVLRTENGREIAVEADKGEALEEVRRKLEGRVGKQVELRQREEWREGESRGDEEDQSNYT